MHDTPHMPTTDLLGTVEAADLIGVERSTLSRWMATGRIAAAMKLPGRNGAVLFERSEVDRVAAAYAAGEYAPGAEATA